MAGATALLILMFAVPAAFAVTYRVGDATNWDTGNNYDNWVSGKTFAVNDSLWFVYGSTHSVDQVSQSDYNNCAVGNAINTYTGGNNTVLLTTTGAHYFICPTPGHCSQGMKLAVTVSAASSPPSSGTPPATPSTPPTGTPPGTPSTPSPPGTPSPPPPPPPSGATGGLCGINTLLVGGSFMLASVVALMG